MTIKELLIEADDSGRRHRVRLAEGDPAGGQPAGCKGYPGRLRSGG